ncbi:MAG: HD domain-containing protein [Verrucomicrobium sp.]|nr:HD domain-containing protein [Verrucomicrobium sp.]
MTPLYGKLAPTLHRIAAQAHKGDFDDQGKPYVEHYERACSHIRRLAAERGVDNRTLDLALCAAAIHDVAEDHGLDRGFNLTYLRRRGLPEEVLEVVTLLTHAPGESYADYAVKLSRHPAAALAKLGDLADNSDPARSSASPARREIYRLTTAFLGGELSEEAYRAAMAPAEKQRALEKRAFQRAADAGPEAAGGLPRVR